VRVGAVIVVGGWESQPQGEGPGQSHLLDIKNNQLEHIMEWVVNK
jgi:hypothetical protein